MNQHGVAVMFLSLILFAIVGSYAVDLLKPKDSVLYHIQRQEKVQGMFAPDDPGKMKPVTDDFLEQEEVIP